MNSSDEEEAIYKGNAALKAVVGMLAAAAPGSALDGIKADDLATLLTLVTDRLDAGERVIDAIQDARGKRLRGAA